MCVYRTDSWPFSCVHCTPRRAVAAVREVFSPIDRRSAVRVDAFASRPRHYAVAIRSIRFRPNETLVRADSFLMTLSSSLLDPVHDRCNINTTRQTIHRKTDTPQLTCIGREEKKITKMNIIL